MIDKSALEIESGKELEKFDLGEITIGHDKYTVLTGYENSGRQCWWCGGELKGKQKHYHYGHMKEYYRHFNWGYASFGALKRAGHKCENCGTLDEKYLSHYSGLRTPLEVHHIVSLKGKSRFFSAYNLPWNLIVLCHECHQEIHAVMRNSNKPLQQDSWKSARTKGQGIMELV